MSDWPSAPFGTLYDVPSKNGLMAPSAVRGTGARLVNMREIFAYDCISNQPMELAPIPSKTPDVWMLRPGDLLFARQSLTLAGAGKVVLVGDLPEPTMFESHIIRVRLDQARADSGFYYYLFRSQPGRRLIESIVEQVAAAGIRSSDLAALEVPVPPLSEQRRIAAVLGSLDDLIETDIVLARTLAEMTTAAAEKSIAAMANRTMKPLTDYATVTKGFSYKSAELVPSTDVLVGLKNIQRGGVFQVAGLKPIRSERIKSDQIIQAGELVVSMTDLTQGREVVGRPIRIPDCGGAGRMVASLDLSILRPTVGYTSAFLSVALSGGSFHSFAMGYCNGTTVVHLSPTVFQNYLVPDVHPDEALAIGELIAELNRTEDACRAEVADLTRTRDELLPLLMSGRVRVSESMSL